jgi:dTDP-4-dehydrorhamnose reductase
MKKIILLGANGQLGTDIQKHTLSENISITPLTRTEFEANDFKSINKLEQYADHDYLINCIAYHKVDECETNFEQSYKINSDLVGQLAKFCNQNNILFIHISTDYVFDGIKNQPYTENDHPATVNVYGNTKLAGEQLLKSNCEKYFILRIASLFGSKESNDPINFVEKMVHASKNNIKLNVIDNQIMSPTHAKDVALCIKTLIEKNVEDYGVYHATNSGHCSWYEFAEMIFELCGIKADMSPIAYDKFHTTVTRPKYCALDNSKISCYHKFPTWREGLKDYLRIKGHI